MSNGHAEPSWERILDALEAQVIEAEVLVRTLRPTEIAPWQPPAGAGPLPAYLVDRARALLERQQRVTERIPEMLGRLSRQRSLADRINGAIGRTRPSVYVDRSA